MVTFEEWFDPNNITHIRAYKTLCDTGAWPDGFIPEGVDRGSAPIVAMNQMGMAWMNYSIKKDDMERDDCRRRDAVEKYAKEYHAKVMAKFITKDDAIAALKDGAVLSRSNSGLYRFISVKLKNGEQKELRASTLKAIEKVILLKKLPKEKKDSWYAEKYDYDGEVP